MSYAIEMLNITKDFPGIRANDDVTLQVEEKSIHALLGENGAGKSTLMSILFGLYQPTRGTIKVRGQEVKITDPNVATAWGSGWCISISNWFPIILLQRILSWGLNR